MEEASTISYVMMHGLILMSKKSASRTPVPHSRIWEIDETYSFWSKKECSMGSKLRYRNSGSRIHGHFTKCRRFSNPSECTDCRGNLEGFWKCRCWEISILMRTVNSTEIGDCKSSKDYTIIILSFPTERMWLIEGRLVSIAETGAYR